MNRRRKAEMLLITFILFFSLISIFIKEACNNQVQASSFLLDSKDQRLVIIVADHIELQDFAKDEYLKWLFNNSFSALISGRQTGKASMAKAKLAIGSSKRLELSSSYKNAANFNTYSEPLDNQSILGEKGNVIFHDIKNLNNLNKQSDYSSYIGYLGSQLHQHNKKVGIFGNSDTDIINRSSVLLGMDAGGIIDAGDVENTIRLDAGFPGGKRTDFDKLMSLYKENAAALDLAIIDTGDLVRLDYYKKEITMEAYEKYKASIIADISNFTRKLISNAGEGTTFIILSSYPSRSSMEAGLKLTPFVVYDKTGAGFLHAQSTRRTGIIINLDIADYVLEKLIDSKESNITAVTVDKPLWSMLTLTRRLLNTSLMRLPILTWYAIFEIICATAGLIYVLITNNKRNLFIKPMKIIMLVNIVAPAVLLYMSAFDLNSRGAYLGIFILISFTLAILFSQLKTSIGQFLGAALLVNLSITIDLLRESAFIKSSVFGYDPIIGARFYGIGNEFAGVFIGSGILLAGCILQRYKSLMERRPKTTAFATIVYSCFQLFIMGMPFIGANFGGTIAAVVGYFFFYCSVNQRRIKIKQFLLLAVIVAIALSSIIALDLMNPSSTTHVGKFVTDIKENGVKVLFSTLTRKAAMNLKLIKYTIWTKVLLCIILIITIMFFKPVRLLHSIFKKYRYFCAAWIGISAGSIAGLLVNDSGIVMAATAMIFTGYSILYMCLEERSAVE